MKSNFVSFYSFDSIHVRLLPETVPKCTTVTQTVTECPRLRTLQVGSLSWATSEKFQNSQLCKLGDTLSNARALPWEPDNLSSSPVHKFPHSQPAPNPTASTMLGP